MRIAIRIQNKRSSLKECGNLHNTHIDQRLFRGTFVEKFGFPNVALYAATVGLLWFAAVLVVNLPSVLRR